MPSKKIPIKKLDDFKPPTCANCSYKVTENIAGNAIEFCYRYPPKILLDDEGSPWILRPSVEDNDLACGEFRPVN